MASSLKSRVEALEAALGIDIGTQDPIRDNLARNTQRTVASMASDLALVVHLIQGLGAKGLIPEWMIQVSRLKVDRDRLNLQIRELELLSSGIDVGIFSEPALARLADMKQRLRELDLEIEQMEKAHDEVSSTG